VREEVTGDHDEVRLQGVERRDPGHATGVPRRQVEVGEVQHAQRGLASGQHRRLDAAQRVAMRLGHRVGEAGRAEPGDGQQGAGEAGHGPTIP
jgi:hypothetical protein